MNNDTTKTKKVYSHLSIAEREEFAIGLEKGYSLRSIARNLGRSAAALCLERQRNGAAVYNCAYRAVKAQARADKRKKGSHERRRLANWETRLFVETKLKESWSPELIAGRLAKEQPELYVNHESIYQWIYYERRDLIVYLEQSHKRRHRRTGKKARKVLIPNRVDIGRRPAVVEDRKQAGHWEGDTVVSRRSKAAGGVFVERKSRLYLAVKMDAKTKEEMYNAAVFALGSFPPHLRRSLTLDNGTENVLHEAIGAALGLKTYFCQPYHSWEKGSVENRNRLLRKYFPKNFDFRLTNQEELNRICNVINNRPMKCLGYKTPNEVFFNCLSVKLRN